VLGGDARIECAEQADTAVRLRAEADEVTNIETPRRLREGAPAALVHPLGQIERHRRLVRSAHAYTFERRRNDARVVEYEDIVRLQQRRKIAHYTILEQRITARPHDQQARSIARHGRMEGYAVLGQIEVEVSRTHEYPITSSRSRAKDQPLRSVHPSAPWVLV